MYRRVIRPTLFGLGGDAEAVHHRTVTALGRFGAAGPAAALGRRRFAVSDPVEIAGVRFPNRVGLAAGMDKDGVALDAWPALGFGFVEVGTVTRHAQPGNPKPRLFRLPRSGAVINRMGFNNAGAAALAERLRTREVRRGPLPVPLGISLGKSKVTPVEEAVDDYLESLRSLHAYADYFAINVSSPNTPGLRSLQGAEQLDALVRTLVAETTRLAVGAVAVPVFVKLAPDLSEPALAEAVGVCVDAGAAGIIATNTTLGRNGLAPLDASIASEAGGLSGRPLHARAVEVVRFVRREVGEQFPIIGIGGVFAAEDARRMVDAGANLVQLYTGLIFEGPALVRDVATALRDA